MITRGLWSSAVLGATGAAVAWLLAALGPRVVAVSGGAARLDQLTMWLLGGMIGVAVLGGRASRIGAPIIPELLGGLSLGGIAALIPATLALLLPVPASPAGFLLLRALAWCVAGASLALTLAAFTRPERGGIRGEATVIGATGGLVAGLLYALPGPSELTQALAFLTLGVSVGLALALPWLRHALAVADQVPRRGPVPGILSLREALLYEGSAVQLGSALLACQGGRVALYPASVGVVLNGRAVVEPRYLGDGGTLLVAEQRYRIRLPATKS